MSSRKCAQCGMVNWATASVCKRCGGTLNGVQVSAASRASVDNSSYPRGRPSHEAKAGDTVKPCLHCGKDLALTKWDSWNGFLVQCPNCGGLHGKVWSIRNVLLASFVFNAFSFLFTMRPPRSVLALIGFLTLVILSNLFVLNSEVVPDMLEMVVAGVLLLGPMLINAILLVKHERDLDNSAPPIQA